MNILVLIDPVGPLLDQPSIPASTQLSNDKIVFSSSGAVVESERVKPIFEMLDVPLQIGVVNLDEGQRLKLTSTGILEITTGSFVEASGG